MTGLVSGDRQTPWADGLPVHSSLRPLKYHVGINQKVLPEDTAPDSLISYIDIGSVDSLGRIGPAEEVTFDSAPSRARRVPADGDTIVSTVRTYLKAIAYMERPDARTVCSTGFAVLSPRARLNPRFLSYWMRSQAVVDEICARSVGVSYPGINALELGSLPVPLLPLQRQRVLAAFLDRKTAAIDQLIQKKERLIELLQEKRQALITQAVTKGLDPNVPMKDSGVEWLEELPLQWGVQYVKQFTQIVRGRFSHRPRNDPSLYDGPFPFVQTGDVAGAGRHLTEYSQTLNRKGYAVSKEFPKGTLVMAIAANVGDVAILDFNACFPDSLVGFVPSAAVRIDYLYYLFLAMRQVLESTTTVNTQGNLNVDRIGSLFAPLPPVLEQQAICAFLDRRVTDDLRIMEKVREQIESLREYRQALISAAVTGQIDVGNEAA